MPREYTVLATSGWIGAGWQLIAICDTRAEASRIKSAAIIYLTYCRHVNDNGRGVNRPSSAGEFPNSLAVLCDRIRKCAKRREAINRSLWRHLWLHLRSRRHHHHCRWLLCWKLRGGGLRSKGLSAPNRYSCANGFYSHFCAESSYLDSGFSDSPRRTPLTSSDGNGLWPSWSLAGPRS